MIDVYVKKSIIVIKDDLISALVHEKSVMLDTKEASNR